ncbi:MAG: lytic transglycosylase domain-containing protein [Nocardioides sp.]
MSTPRFGRMQKASALVPLALLSAAWTASLAGVGATEAASADTHPNQLLPDGTSVPTEAIEAPASVSVPGMVAPGVGNAQQAVSTASTSGIPSAALAAYQRAETVINSADKTCNMPWQLVAAIGRVESDHGRTNGNHLDDNGVARPGIYGIALNGKNGTQRILDTDAGQYDADSKFDRAVGPMQFIPSTWSVVGVDADGDAQRNPQDIDDAALATAVYLCSGNDDLSTEAGQRSAVYRYNHSSSYVDLVTSIMRAYMAGDFTSVPNGTTSGGYLVPVSTAGSTHAQGGGRHHHVKHDHTSTGGGSTTPTQQPTQPSSPTTPSSPSTPSNPTSPLPTLPVPTPTLPPLPSPSVPPVDQVLTLAQAVAQCTADGLVDNPLSSTDAFDKCVAELTGH